MRYTVLKTVIIVGFVIAIQQTVAQSQTLQTFSESSNVLYVDNDSPLDPGPNNLQISDPRENGSPTHPFDSIQEAIRLAMPNATIWVRAGTYREPLDFLGKAITVKGGDINKPHESSYPILMGIDTLPMIRFDKGESETSQLDGFVISGGLGEQASAILCENSSPIISHCIIVGNWNTDQEDPNAPSGAAVVCIQSEARFNNCTISHNRNGMTLIDSPVQILQTILRGNIQQDLHIHGTGQPSILYSNLGNIAHYKWSIESFDADPHFVEPGHWGEPFNTATPGTVLPPNTAWIPGDYHLQSESGHWVPQRQMWVLDAVNSPCIDAGDPNHSIDAEMLPNGNRINIGAYGGTAAASRTPPDDSEPVVFGDHALQFAVEESLSICSPTPRDMLTLTELSCITKSVRDITGLEYALNLQELILTDNRGISDISVLAGLSQLTKFVANENNIEDISILSRLPLLRHLDIHQNRFMDISALASLEHLEIFVGKENSIRDLSPLKDLTKLTVLNLRHNPISDISHLATLTNIQYLDFYDCMIEDLSPLLGYNHLRFLDISYNYLNEDSRNLYIPTLLEQNADATIIWAE